MASHRTDSRKGAKASEEEEEESLRFRTKL